MRSFEAVEDVDEMLNTADGLGFRQTALINQALREFLPGILEKMGEGKGTRQEKRAAA